MEFTPEELALGEAYRAQVTATVLEAIANAPKAFSDEEHAALAFGLTLDGMLAALAYIAEGAEFYPAQRDKRRFADQVREGLLKFMKAARADIDRGVSWEDLPASRPN